MATGKPIIFLSHSSRDAQVAILLSQLLSEIFNDFFNTFNSSDGSIQPGSVWRDDIQRNLKEAVAVLIVLSPHSVDRAWVNFEAGAAWMRGDATLLVPCTIGDVSLPSILEHLQSIRLDDSKGLQELIKKLSAPANQNPRLQTPFYITKAQEFKAALMEPLLSISDPEVQVENRESISIPNLTDSQKGFLLKMSEDVVKELTGIRLKLVNSNKPWLFKSGKQQIEIDLSDTELLHLSRLGYLNIFTEPDPIEIEITGKLFVR